MNDRDDAIRSLAGALLALVDRELPKEFEVTGDADAWPLIGAGLLSRMSTTLQTITAIQPAEREADAGTLVRSLYEHAVHLAWLAADPSPERIEAWRKDDLRSRLTADGEFRERGAALFSDADRGALEAQVASMRGDPLRLANLAVAADKFWAGRLPGMGAQTEMRSFRGLYAVVYRMYSGVAHPSYRGLNPVVQDVTATRRRVILESSYESNDSQAAAAAIPDGGREWSRWAVLGSNQ